MNKQACKAFIGGLSWETTDEKLRRYFENYGEVLEAFVSHDRRSGRSRGFGFVVFQSPAVVDKVVSLNHMIDRREVEAKRAVPRDESAAAPPVAEPASSSRTRKVFVGGLAPTVDDALFRDYFRQFGEVEDAVVMYDHVSRRPRGFGFITYTEEAAVDKVFAQGFLHTIAGKQIEIKRAVPRDQMPATGRRTPGHAPAFSGRAEYASAPPARAGPYPGRAGPRPPPGAAPAGGAYASSAPGSYPGREMGVPAHVLSLMSGMQAAALQDQLGALQQQAQAQPGPAQHPPGPSGLPAGLGEGPGELPVEVLQRLAAGGAGLGSGPLHHSLGGPYGGLRDAPCPPPSNERSQAPGEGAHGAFAAAPVPHSLSQLAPPAFTDAFSPTPLGPFPLTTFGSDKCALPSEQGLDASLVGQALGGAQETSFLHHSVPGWST